MFNIEIADMIVTIDNKYSYTKLRCRDYFTYKDNNTGIVLSVTKERMQESIDYKFNFDGEQISFPEAEFDAIHYPLYKELYRYDGFWLHSVLMEKGGFGYALTAVPGTGKTTHAKLWIEVFDDATIVNGDNSIIRRNNTDGIFYGYGTPFSGKEGFNKNRRVPMKAICFLERSETNYVEKIKPTDAGMSMINDYWCMKNGTAGNLMRLYIDIAEQVNFYRVHCNMDKEAANIAYGNISK